MDAVLKYRRRRALRLGTQEERDSIKAYKIRRAERMALRFDDEDENKNGDGGSHGNTKIPFGLCQREGISIDPKWTPKDAWEALEGKGYSAKESYEELKKTGKVSKKSAGTTKKPPTKIEEKHFPTEMMEKAYKKNTMEMAKFVSDYCDDGNITEFMSSAMGAGAKKPPKIKCTRSKSGEGCYINPETLWGSDEVVGMEIRIPMLSQCKNEKEKEEAIRSMCHEWAHYMDFLAREEKENGMFTEKDKDLQDAFSKINLDTIQDSISDEAKEVFRSYNEKEEKLIAEYKENKKNIWREVVTSMYGPDEEEWPGWIEKEEGDLQGEAVYYYGWRKTDKYGRTPWNDKENFRKYEKALKAAKKKLYEECMRSTRALEGGVSSLQGLYDSLSCGKLMAAGVTKYGHRESYFRGGVHRGTEVLAGYVSLKATNRELADMFTRNYPEIAKALDETIVRITNKLRGGT